MNKVKNILVLQSRIEIMVSVTGLGHGIPVCGFHKDAPKDGIRSTDLTFYLSLLRFRTLIYY